VLLPLPAGVKSSRSLFNAWDVTLSSPAPSFNPFSSVFILYQQRGAFKTVLKAHCALDTIGALLLFTQLKLSVPPTCRFWMPSSVNQVGLMFAIQLAWLSCSVGAGLMMAKMVVEASCDRRSSTRA
jgi:hypothetical protein